MVKYKPIKENIFREYFSYIVDPILSFSKFTDSKYAHRYKTGKASNVASYFNRFVSENKTRQIYKEMDYLHYSSREDLEQQKKQGLIPKNIHPLDEQNWFIDYLRPRIDIFSAEDAWMMMLNMGQRDKYHRFVSKKVAISQFEIFVQNYFFSALAPSKLVEIFLLAYDSEEVERKERLKNFLDNLCFRQTTLLIETLQKITVDEKLWASYCESLLCSMRNAQIKDVLFSLPEVLEEAALKKLYPCEVIEVIEKVEQNNKREALIRKVLENGNVWWDGFSHDDIRQTYAILRSY